MSFPLSSTPPSYLIRPATRGECEELIALVQAIALESENRALDPGTVRKGVYAVFEHPERGTYWVMVHPESEKILGTTLVTVEWSDWNNGFYWWLQSVYIHPGYRGRGLFSILLEALQAEAKAHGAVELKLYVDAQNTRAIQAYLKNGFQKDHYYLMTRSL